MAASAPSPTVARRFAIARAGWSVPCWCFATSATRMRRASPWSSVERVRGCGRHGPTGAPHGTAGHEQSSKPRAVRRVRGRRVDAPSRAVERCRPARRHRQQGRASGFRGHIGRHDRRQRPSEGLRNHRPLSRRQDGGLQRDNPANLALGQPGDRHRRPPGVKRLTRAAKGSPRHERPKQVTPSATLSTSCAASPARPRQARQELCPSGWGAKGQAFAAFTHCGPSDRQLDDSKAVEARRSSNLRA